VACWLSAFYLNVYLFCKVCICLCNGVSTNRTVESGSPVHLLHRFAVPAMYGSILRMIYISPIRTEQPTTIAIAMMRRLTLQNSKA